MSSYPWNPRRPATDLENIPDYIEPWYLRHVMRRECNRLSLEEMHLREILRIEEERLRQYEAMRRQAELEFQREQERLLMEEQRKRQLEEARKGAERQYRRETARRAARREEIGHLGQVAMAG